MKYKFAEDLQEIAKDVSKLLFPHVQLDRVRCIRSWGSSTKRTIARCHALGKVMQTGMGCNAFYTIEFLAEKFDKLSEEDQLKTIIHELMHIPKTFGGGFQHHNYVTNKNVNIMYKTYINLKKENERKKNWFGI